MKKQLYKRVGGLGILALTIVGDVGVSIMKRFGDSYTKVEVK